jgi:hypothetical protein
MSVVQKRDKAETEKLKTETEKGRACGAVMSIMRRGVAIPGGITGKNRVPDVQA